MKKSADLQNATTPTTPTTPQALSPMQPEGQLDFPTPAPTPASTPAKNKRPQAGADEDDPAVLSTETSADIASDDIALTTSQTDGMLLARNDDSATTATPSSGTTEATGDIIPNATPSYGLGVERLLAVGIPLGGALIIGSVGNLGTSTSSTPPPPKAGLSPSVTISHQDTGTGVVNAATGEILYTFTFSAAVSGFTADDIIVSNATKGAFTQVSDTLYTLVITAAPNVTGNVTVDVAAGSAADASGNLISAALQSVLAVDTMLPTAVITVADTALAAGETSLVTITFSEAVAGFTNAGLRVTNGTLSTVTSADGGVTWTAMLTPSDGTTSASNDIALASASATDLAGNPNNGVTFSNNYAVDTVVPTATIVVANNVLNAGETSLATITFSEPVIGFTNADLIIGNGTLSTVTSTDGGVTWTATLTPSASTTSASNDITLASASVTDLAGNPNNGVTYSNNYAVDTVSPAAIETVSPATIVVADDSLIIGETSLVTITFGQAVTGFTNADLSVTNGTLSTVTSADGGLTWTAILTPSASTTSASNDITLDSTSVTGVAGNPLSGVTYSNNYAVDTVVPTATIVVTDAALIAGETSLVTITFSEAVTGVTNTNLSVTNGTLSTVTSVDGGLTWTATLTPSAGTTSASNDITLASASVTDLAGNPNNGVTLSNNYAVDTVVPTATIVVADNILNVGETSLTTITFSEAVIGFTNADLIIGNGTLSTVTSADGGVTWTATLTPSASTTSASNDITLASASVTDLAGNPNNGATHSNTYAVDTAVPVEVPSTRISTTPAFSGQAVISGKALAGATIDIVIDPDNNAATANSFTYSTTADALGNYSVDLATATPVSGSAGFLAGTASVSVTQTTTGAPSAVNVFTLPTLLTTSYSVSIASDYVTEGGNAVFTITRSGDTSGTGTVDYATQNGTASAGSDYTGVAATTLTFAAGETTKTVTVATLTDTTIEGNETLSLVLNNPVGGSLGTASASATIVDTDVGLFSIVGAATGVSFSEGVGTTTFTVTRSGLTTGAATVEVSSIGVTAGADDYTAVNQTLSFAAGETSKTVTVTIADDALVEGNETFKLQLSNASAGNFIDAANARVTATIEDNEVAVISLNDAAAGLTFNEGVGSVTFGLTRSGQTTSAVSVVVQSSGGTATAGADYTAINQTISFAAGETSKTVTLLITDDVIAESNETFFLQLGSPSAGAVISAGSAIATIIDNDQSVWNVGASTARVDEGAGFITYTVSRTGASAAATISFATASAGATAGSDYTAVNQVLTFAAGELSKTVQVAVLDDAVAEGDEGVIGIISNASSGTINTAIANVTIVDNDQSIWGVATDTSIVDEGAGFISYTVSRTVASAAATINFATAGGSATAGVDYTAVNRTLSFAAGETSKTVLVAVVDDATPEGNETVVARISNASSGSIATGTDGAMATINDNDQSVWGVATATAGVDEGAGFITYTVSRTGASAAATINFATGGGSATAGSDYTAVNQTLSFAAGELSKTVQVAVLDDAVAEGNETVTGTISAASGGSINTGVATATINDNDQSVWSVSRGTLGGVSEGTGFIPYTVSRTGATDAATINFATAGGTATAGSDYTAVNQTLSFAAGELSKTVLVAVVDDTIVEPIELLYVSISNASSGTIDTGTAGISIVDNDQSIWRVTVSNSSQISGPADEGAGFIAYNIHRFGDMPAATINFATADGTAKAGNDYTAVDQVLTFAAGESSKTVLVAVTDDMLLEDDESLVGSISNASSGTIDYRSATATIIDNDQSVWRVRASTAAVDEGAGFITYTVDRTVASAAATINFATGGGSATAGSDYTAVNQTLSFAAGELSKTVQVAVLDDAVAEGNETVNGVISAASSGTINSGNGGKASASIIDNDQSLWSVGTETSGVDEGAGFISYRVSRTGASAAATINFATSGGSATAGSDYTAVNQTLSFAAGEMLKTVLVAVTNDATPETNESVVASISNASSGSIVRGTVVPTIFDDDQSVWSVASAGNIRVDEGSGFAAFSVSRRGTTGAGTIEFATAGSGATAGSDYIAVRQTLTFAAGETEKTVLVTILDDAVPEIGGGLNVSISNASSGTIGTASAGVSIVDDDQSVWRIGTDASVSESAGFVTFTVMRFSPVGAATVQFVTTGGSATAGADYTDTSQTLSFADGEVSKNILVAITDDATPEGNETVSGIISSVSSGALSPSVAATATIYDDDQSVWSVATVPFTDSDEGAGFITYTVSRTGATPAATISFATAGGTATAGSDYTAVNQVLTFAAGEISKTVLVAVLDDAIAEGNETVLGVISAASSGTLAVPMAFTNDAGAASATIRDNDQSFWSVTAAGGSESAGFITYTVTRSGATGAAATIRFATAGGSAMAGSDYTAVNQVLTFAAGETRKTVLVAVADDAVAETNETLVGIISNASSGSIDTGVATATISDDDQSIWSVGGLGFVNQPNEGAGGLSYTVSRSVASAAATIVFATAGGTATAGSDYTAMNQTLTFAVGETFKIVTVAVTDDAVAEGNESVEGVISAPSSGTIGTANVTLSIVDNDQSVWSVAAADGNESAGFITYTVSRSGPSAAATIRFATAGGSAMAGSDYTAVNQVLTFAEGETRKNILVAVTDDAVAEANETIVGVISNASSGSIGTGTATATVADDDSTGRNTYAISVTSNNTLESTGVQAYTINRSGDLTQASTSYFRTNGGTAQTDGSDYTVVSGQTLSWAQGEATKVVLVSLTNDAIAEGSETIIGQSALDAGFTVGAATATATVLDDEPTGTNAYAISVTSNNTQESTGVQAYTITRSGDRSQASTSYFRTNGGTAQTDGSDYTVVSGQTLSWAVGEATKVVLVSLTDDAIAEGSETIIGQSATDVGFTTGITSATATVLDDEPTGTNAYAISVTSNNTLESTGVQAYTITRSGDRSQASTSYFRTNGGTTQTDGSDYTVDAGQTLSWAVGETTKVVLVSLTDDAIAEGNETIIGQSATDVGFTTGATTATATVFDDDTYTATAGVADTLTTGTANGGYTGGYIIDTGDLNDTVTIGNLQQNFTFINLGAGDDTLNAASATNLLVNGAHYQGGAGVDTLGFTAASTANLLLPSIDDMFTGFEIINLGTGNQTLNLNLGDVFAMTTGNAVANTLRIQGTAGDVVNLQPLGKPLGTPAAGSTFTDVDGISYTVTASAAGNASANDVTIGGNTYDVYQYDYASQTITMLLATAITTNVI